MLENFLLHFGSFLFFSSHLIDYRLNKLHLFNGFSANFNTILYSSYLSRCMRFRCYFYKMPFYYLDHEE